MLGGNARRHYRLLGALLATWGLFACAGRTPRWVAPCSLVYLQPDPPDRCERKKPSMNLAKMAAERSAVLKVCWNCQLGSLAQLIQKTPDDAPEKPDLLFRLGEGYVEQAYATLARIDEYDEQIVLAADKDDANRLARLRSYRQGQACLVPKLWAAALYCYTQVITNRKYRKFEKMAQALSYVVTCALQLGKMETAQGTLSRLERDHPSSPYISVALLAFGEHHFDKEQLPRALAYYDRIIQRGDGIFDSYVLYKRAWIAYAQQDYPQALALFSEYLTKPREKKEWSYRLIARAVLRDLVQTYAHCRAPEEAWEFFGQHHAREARALLAQLAELYLCRGDIEVSRALYRQLLEE